MKIIFVDDDQVQLDRYTLVLHGESSLEIAGIYSDPRLAYAELESVLPDLMITDIGMPNMSGIELIKKARAKLPEMEIIAITVHGDMPTVFDALKSGATGYLLKSISNQDMLKAIRELNSGGVPITPKIARAILLNMQMRASSISAVLSGKERNILRQINLGFGYKEVADKMCVSPHAIHYHVKSIYKKLDVNCRKDALLKAGKDGLL